MLPVTEASLASRMQVTNSTWGTSRELDAYVRREYGGNASFVRATLTNARKAASEQARRELGSRVSRVLEATRRLFVTAPAAPGSA